LASVDSIAAIDPSVAPTGVDLGTAAAPAFAADVIVLLTDGANTQGVTPDDAAKVAAARGVRVFTIGFGTTTPTPMACTGSQVEGFGGGGGGYSGGGGVNPLIIDEAALQNVAKTTGGRYYRAQNSDQLQSALGDLPSHVTVTRQKIDLAAWFAGGGGLLVALAVGLSLWWSRIRLPRPSRGALHPGSS
jgi:Ca-activated chloride channel family protein